MIFAQLIAYGRVMKTREAGKERQRRKDETSGMNGYPKRSASYWDEDHGPPNNRGRKVGFANGHSKEFQRHDEPDSLTEEESEVIL